MHALSKEIVYSGVSGQMTFVTDDDDNCSRLQTYASLTFAFFQTSDLSMQTWILETEGAGGFLLTSDRKEEKWNNVARGPCTVAQSDVKAVADICSTMYI